jgi:hypothetical protein
LGWLGLAKRAVLVGSDPLAGSFIFFMFAFLFFSFLFLIRFLFLFSVLDFILNF